MTTAETETQHTITTTKRSNDMTETEQQLDFREIAAGPILARDVVDRAVYEALRPTAVVRVIDLITYIDVSSIRIGDRIEVRGIEPAHDRDVWDAEADGSYTYTATLDTWPARDGRAVIRVPIWAWTTESLPRDFSVTVYRGGEPVDRLVVGNGG